MNPFLFQTNGVLPDSEYLLGQPSFSYPIRPTQALLTCHPPSSGTLTLTLEMGGVLTVIAFTVPASAEVEVTQALAIDLSVPAIRRCAGRQRLPISRRMRPRAPRLYWRWRRNRRHSSRVRWSPRSRPGLNSWSGQSAGGTLTASGFRASLLTEAAPAFLSPGG